MNLLDSPPFGLSPEDLIVAMAGLAATLTVLALWLALVPREFGASRARALVNRKTALRAAALAPRKRASMRTQDVMRSVVGRLHLLRSRRADQIAQQLARAGHRGREAVVTYMFVKATMPFLAAALVGLPVMVFGFGGLSSRSQLVVALGAVLLGYVLPDLYVKNQATKRQDKLRKSLPDALDLMVICAEAGLSLDSTMQRVARELGRPHPEIADEFGLTAVELGFMPDRRRALENLSARSTLPAVRALVNALLQTDKFGTPLAHSLRVLSNELRTERTLRAEEKAAKLPAVMTVPMIVFILPPLFVILLGPAVLSILDQFINR